MRLTDRMHDFLASLGASPGEAGLSSQMSVLPPTSLFDGDGGIIGDGLPLALLGFDDDSAGVVGPDNGLGALAAAGEDLVPVDPNGADDDAGVSGEILLSEEPLFVFDGPQLSQTGGPATRFVSDYSHAAFDPAEAIRNSFWYDDASVAPVAAAGQAAPPGDGMLGAADLTFIDFASYAKGGNGGGKGGDKGDGGGGDGALSSYVSGDPGGYNIEINFKNAWTVDLQAAFITSSELISDLIIGDISDVFYRGKIIDDIRIDAELKEIDGEGGILGQAGPTAIRTANYLPATAIMQFDIADANALNASGLWQDVVFHEMLHSVGFGTVWSYLDLLDGAGTANPLFNGAAAIYAYERDFGALDAVGVPVEGDGGSGTRDSHWDEETFDNEIMTGYIDNLNYLSEMTVASLEDTGYDTVWDESFFFA